MSTHGDVVQKYLSAYNPCIDIDHYKVEGNTARNIYKSFTDILGRVVDGEKIDYINFSIGDRKKITEFGLKGKMGNKIYKHLNKNYANEKSAYCNIIDRLADSGVRILFSASNKGKDFFNKDLLFAKGADGVGALNKFNKKGKEIADFSSSRIYGGASHYEQGVFKIQNYKKGTNVTGTSGIDFEFPLDFKKFIKSGKYEKLIVTNEEMQSLKLKKEIPQKYQDRVFKLKDYLELTNTPAELTKEHENTYVYKGFLFNPNETSTSPIIGGTSFSTPIRTAKLALHDSLKDLLP